MIVAVEILPKNINIVFSHLGDHIEETISHNTPKNQRFLLPLIVENIKKTAGNHIDALSVVTTASLDKSKQKLLTLQGTSYKNLKIVSPLSKLLNCQVIINSSAEAGVIAELKQYKKTELETRLVYLQIDSYATCSALAIQSSLSQDSSYQINVGSQIVSFEPPHTQTFDDFLYGLFSNNTISKETLDNLNANEHKLVAEHLAIGIFNTIALCKPDYIAVGGAIRNYYKKLAKPLNSKLKTMGVDINSIKINYSHFPNSALQGAMLLANSL